jgi:hypothetical protein
MCAMMVDDEITDMVDGFANVFDFIFTMSCYIYKRKLAFRKRLSPCIYITLYHFVGGFRVHSKVLACICYPWLLTRSDYQKSEQGKWYNVYAN